MEKKILIALDGSVASKQAVQYVTSVGIGLPDLWFTLYHVLSPISQIRMDASKSDTIAQKEVELIARRNRETAENLMESYRSLMGDFEIDAARVDIKVVNRREGVAKDILEYGQESRHNAIVVGRRGISRLKAVFMGSVTASLLENSNFLPIWVVDGAVSFRSVIMAVDGSESALRAVDHLCFVLGGNLDIQITLFHVTSRFSETCPIDARGEDSPLAAVGQRGSKHCIDDFQRKALEKLGAAGFRNDQVHIKMVDRMLGAGKAILDEAETENHDTIVIGRRGLSRSLFTGSVSRYVMDHAAGHALWVIS